MGDQGGSSRNNARESGSTNEPEESETALRNIGGVALTQMRNILNALSPRAGKALLTQLVSENSESLAIPTNIGTPASDKELQRRIHQTISDNRHLVNWKHIFSIISTEDKVDWRRLSKDIYDPTSQSPASSSDPNSSISSQYYSSPLRHYSSSPIQQRSSPPDIPSSPFVPSSSTESTPRPSPEILEMLSESLKSGTISQLLEHVKSPEQVPIPDDFIDDDGDFSYDPENDLILRNQKILVGDDEDIKRIIIGENHKCYWGGDTLNVQRTLQSLEHFYWHGMHTDVEKFVPEKYQKMLPTAHYPFQSIYIDVIYGLPKSGGYDRILLIVDRFSNYSIILPCGQHYMVREIQRAVVAHVFQIRGSPQSIISGLAPKHNQPKHWKPLPRGFDFDFIVSNSFRNDPGYIATTTCLRRYIQSRKEEWLELLPWAAFIINAEVYDYNPLSPFERAFGRRAHLPMIMRETATGNPEWSDTFFECAVTKKLIQNTEENDPSSIDVNKHDRVLVNSSHFENSENPLFFERTWQGPFKINKMNKQLGVYYIELPEPMDDDHALVFSKYLRKFELGLVPMPGETTKSKERIDFYDFNPKSIITIDCPEIKSDGKLWYPAVVRDHKSYTSTEDFRLEDLSDYKDLVRLVHQVHPSAPQPPTLAQFLER